MGTARVRLSTDDQLAAAGDAVEPLLAGQLPLEPADLLAHRRLRVVPVVARGAAAELEVRVILALRVLGREVGADLVRVTGVVPLAVVVAAAGVLVEVTIRLAGRVVLAGDLAEVA